MLRNAFLRGVLVVAVSTACVHARSQTFNVDLDSFVGDSGTGSGAPSDSFGGAAGTPGVWNRIDGGSVTPTMLLGLNGGQSQVMLSMAGGISGAYGYRNPIDSGDYALLMNDAADVSGENDYIVSGLQPGRYLVYTYAVNPSGRIGLSTVTIAGADDPVQTCTGPIPGDEFIQGVTHTVHSIDLTGDTIQIQVSASRATYCNGFQVVAVPEPSSLFAFAALGLVLIVWGRPKVL